MELYNCDLTETRSLSMRKPSTTTVFGPVQREPTETDEIIENIPPLPADTGPLSQPVMEGSTVRSPSNPDRGTEGGYAIEFDDSIITTPLLFGEIERRREAEEAAMTQGLNTTQLRETMEQLESRVRQRAENEFFGMPVSEENPIRGRSPLESAAVSLQGIDATQFREAMARAARASRSLASFGDIQRSAFGLPPIEEERRQNAAQALEAERQRQPAAPKEKPPSPLGTQERTITIE